VVNENAWGEQAAVDRGYCRGTEVPKQAYTHDNKPLKLGDPNNLQGPGYDNDVKDGWLRGGGKGGEAKPNSYVPNHRAPRGDERSHRMIDY
jgi:hypothetical protein